MRQLILATLLLATVPVHAATVYRCDSGGHPTFTDRPCDAGEQTEVVASNPNVTAPPSESEKDLARQHDERLKRERMERDKADAEWARQHDAQKAKEDRVRSGVVEGKIVRGMTPQQVEEVLGKPGEVSHGVKNGADQDHWTYRDGDVMQTVTFTGGQVTGYTKRHGAAHPKKKKK